jgi:light-regulated signal transduction histidine kinase (bacteriophytochrome)
MSAAARALASSPVDLTDCDREPIHIPGAIQPHGMLLSVREPDLVIMQVSANAALFTGVAPEELVGRPLGTLFPRPSLDLLGRALSAERPEENNPLPLSLGERSFDGMVHRYKGATILEIEPRGDEGEALRGVLRLKATLARLSAARSLRELGDVAVQEIRRFTGYDRVLLYRFDEDGHGEVIAEDRREGLESYLGLHYPASDIPRQARELYLLNGLRIIPDRTAAPASILPALRPDTGAPLDLTFSVLRAVSPIHLEYMRNIGFRASMSISLVHGGSLWGLVSCSHGTPRLLPCAMREACEIIGQLLASQIVAKERQESLAEAEKKRGVLARLCDCMRSEGDVLDGLVRRSPNLLDLVEAGGAAIYRGGTCRTLGQTPSAEQIRMLVGWLRATVREEIFATADLARHYPAAERFKHLASGLLAFSLPRPDPEYVLWFRPEVLQTVSWGGDPSKPVEVEPGALRLSPRRSFALWREVVRGKSAPFRDADIEAVARLRQGATEIDLARQVEREQAARAAAEAAQIRFSLLRDAGAVLIGSLDYEATLGSVARIATDRFADICVIDLIDEAGVLRRVQVHHANPSKQELAERLYRYTPFREGSSGPRMLADGRAKLRARLDRDWLSANMTQDDGQLDLIWNRLRVRSFIAAPLVARGRILGEILLMGAESGRIYDEADLALADELARRAATAIENAGLYRRMQDAFADARDAARARDELLAAVSHDIGNPLSAVVVNAQGLLRTPEGEAATSERVRTIASRILRSATRIQALLRDLTDVERIRAQRFAVEPRPEEVGPMVDEAIELSRPLAEHRSLALTQTVVGGELRVNADRDRVLQVLGNLLENAMKFTPPGGSIAVEVRPQGSEVRFSVRDTGTGIPEEQLPRIFERYYRAPASEGGGTGLGLYLVKGLVEAHGGHIDVKSQPGEGSTFSFTLPLAA